MSLSGKKTELTSTSIIKIGAKDSLSSSAMVGRCRPMTGTHPMLFFLNQGYRVIAHDRRGHGRSTQTSDGHDMNHYADDLAALISAVPPLMVKTEKNPGGLPKEVFDGLQAQLAANRSQFYL